MGMGRALGPSQEIPDNWAVIRSLAAEYTLYLPCPVLSYVTPRQCDVKRVGVMHTYSTYLPVVQVQGVFIPLAIVIPAEHAVSEVWGLFV
jgi:hypothetical protein